MPQKGLLNLDHIGVCFSERKLISANGNLHRIAERRHLANINLYALGNTHIHNAALYCALAVKLNYGVGISDFVPFRVLECKYSFDEKRTAQRR